MPSLILLGLIPLVFALCTGGAGRYIATGTDASGKSTAVGLIWPALAAMALVRLWLAGSMEGYAGDVHTFQAWAMRAGENLAGFYSGGFFADYPPGYMYVLSVIGKLKGLLSLADGSTGFLVLIKLPAIIADLAMALLVYRLASQRMGASAALLFSMMYGFNPAVILNSSVWGQVDAVFTLLVVLSVYWLIQDRLVWSVSMFTLALLVKPQALIFTPLLLTAATDRLLLKRDNNAEKRVVTAALAGLAIFIAGITPFTLTEGPLWIIDHYRSTLTSYPFASVNAYNLFALSGANFLPESGPWLLFPYRSWGTFFIIMAALFSLRIYCTSTRDSRLYLMGLFLIAAVFIFSARMHERYLFPVLIFALLAALYTGSRQLLAIFTGFSITHYVNVAHVLLASTIGITQIPRFDPLLLATATANLMLFIWLVCTVTITRALRDRIPVPE